MKTTIYYGIFTIGYIVLAVLGHGFWAYLGFVMAVTNSFLAGYTYED